METETPRVEREGALDEREAAIERRERLLEARERLDALRLPKEAAALINPDSEDTVAASLEALAALRDLLSDDRAPRVDSAADAPLTYRERARRYMARRGARIFDEP